MLSLSPRYRLDEGVFTRESSLTLQHTNHSTTTFHYLPSLDRLTHPGIPDFDLSYPFLEGSH
jgi:hypothetical protein